MSQLVLIVDDSLMVRKMVSSALEKAGFEVVQAVDGRDALEKAKAQTFALVLTDLNMPVMTGLEFIVALREERSYRFTPIVFLTTEVSPEIQAQAREAGATAWIQKPFQAEKVLSVVQRILAS